MLCSLKAESWPLFSGQLRIGLGSSVLAGQPRLRLPLISPQVPEAWLRWGAAAVRTRLPDDALSGFCLTGALTEWPSVVFWVCSSFRLLVFVFFPAGIGVADLTSADIAGYDETDFSRYTR